MTLYMKQSLSQTIYTEIKRRILHKEFDSNAMISEHSIAKEFNVSKTPAREALMQLSQEGYLSRYPSFGYIIRELSYQDVQDIMELRFILESGALRLIVKLASDEDIRGLLDIAHEPDDTYAKYHEMNARFHGEIGRLSGNAYLHDDIFRMANSTAMPSIYVNFKSRTLTQSDHHSKIVAALLERNIDDAILHLRADILPKDDGRV